MKLECDASLLFDAQVLSDGRHVHALAQDLTIYRSAADFFNLTGRDKWKAAFESAEIALRKFVALARQTRHREFLIA